MRSDDLRQPQSSVRPVPAVGTLPQFDLGLGQHQVLSLVPSLQGPPRPARRQQPGMRLMWRDCQIVILVWLCRALTADLIELALFPLNPETRCQRRLTALVRHRYLDRLPRALVNEKAVYLLTRRSVRGNRLIRQLVGDPAFRHQMTRLGSLGHLLAVNAVRVRILRGCHDLGFRLSSWQRPEDLAPQLTQDQLVPDAYFVIERQDGEKKRGSFFLELERSSAKSNQVLHHKLEQYRRLCQSGRFEQVFGTRALRLLFVLAPQGGGGSDSRVQQAVREAQHLDVPIARFVSLDTLETLPPAACLTRPIWYESGSGSTVPLFPGVVDGDE